jgi:hypothetical protein
MGGLERWGLIINVRIRRIMSPTSSGRIGGPNRIQTRVTDVRVSEKALFRRF